MIRYRDAASAETAILRALEEADWTAYFLTSYNGSLFDIFMDKNTAKVFNQAIPFGGFFDREQAYALLKEMLFAHRGEIAKWLASGGGRAMRVIDLYDEAQGYGFDKNGREVPAKEIRLCLRKDRGTATKLGFFVSNFYPRYKETEN